MSRLVSRLVAVALLAGVAGLPGVISPPGAGAAAAIVVTTTADEMDPNDGLVSLREAVALANATFGTDTVQLGTAARYVLSRCAGGSLVGPVGSLVFNDFAGMVVEGNGSTVSQTCSAPAVTIAGLSPLYQASITGLSITDSPWGLDFDSGGTVTLDRSSILNIAGDCVRSAAPLRLLSTRIDGCGRLGLSAQSSRLVEMVDSEIARAAWGGDVSGATITRSTIHYNQGGLRVSGALTTTNSHFDDNNGSIGGVIAGDVTATNSTFERNASTLVAGGGLLAVRSLTLNAVSVSGNTARAGGGVMVDPAATASISNSRIDNNVATGGGGGIQQQGYGMAPGSLAISNTTLIGNRGVGAGAVMFYASSFTLTDSTVRSNTTLAASPGDFPEGALSIRGPATITGSTIADNVGPTSGGTIWATGGLASGPSNISRSTISGNVGKTGGWFAIDVSNVRDSTIADNVGAQGANVNIADTVTVARSVIGPGAGGPSCAYLAGVPNAKVVSAGFNFDSGNSCGPGAGAGDVVNGGDPWLGPLADNGGATPTRSPLPGSPLIDRVPPSDLGCTGFDQRGRTRPQGPGCDVGSVEWVSPAARFHPMSPIRVLDSRGALGGWSGRLAAGSPRSLTVAVTGAAVPASASAVVMNVTATNASDGSFITLWPKGVAAPNVSNLNFSAGQTIANLVTVKVGAAGAVDVANAVGSTDVVADVVGYFDDGLGAGDLWNAVTPTRLLDSRTPTGGWAAPLVEGAPRSLAVRGVSPVPNSATSAVINVTVTGPSAGTFLTVWPSGGPQPTASNLHAPPGVTIAGLATVKLGGDGSIMLANAVGSTDVVVDVVGYFDATSGSVFHPVTPKRVLDDRVGLGAIGPWPADTARDITGVGGATGVIANITVTNATQGSFVIAARAGAPLPATSTVNFGPGQTIPNLAMTAVSANGQIVLYNRLGSVDLIADVVGYYAAT